LSRYECRRKHFWLAFEGLECAVRNQPVTEIPNVNKPGKKSHGLTLFSLCRSVLLPYQFYFGVLVTSCLTVLFTHQAIGKRGGASSAMIHTIPGASFLCHENMYLPITLTQSKHKKILNT